MSYTVQWCILRVWAKLISHKVEMSDSKTWNRCSQWLIHGVPFTQLFLPLFCIWALITVIFFELTLNPPLQNFILLFGLFYGFQKFLHHWFRNTTLNQAQAYLPLCCPNLLAAELSNAGVIRNHLCLSCIITPSSATSKRLFLPC